MTLTTFTAEELDRRRTGVGGSEIASLLREDPFAGPLDIYLRKVDGWQTSLNADMERGIFLEDGIARWYGHREEAEVQQVASLQFHPIKPHCYCSPDRLVRKDGRQWLLSIKAPGRPGDSWGESGGDVLPTGYVLQLQWEDAILAARGVQLEPVSVLAALVGGELRTYPVDRDEELQGWLLDYAEEWWARHVEARVPPPLDGSPIGTAWLRKRYPRHESPMVEADLVDEVLCQGFREAEERQTAAENAYRLARQQLEERIASAEGIQGAFGRITFRANKNGKRTLLTRWR